MLQLLADRLVERAKSISKTVRQTLKKTNSSPPERMLVRPPKASAEFVCAMEDVLEVYHRQLAGVPGRW